MKMNRMQDLCRYQCPKGEVTDRKSVKNCTTSKAREPENSCVDTIAVRVGRTFKRPEWAESPILPQGESSEFEKLEIAHGYLAIR